VQSLTARFSDVVFMFNEYAGYGGKRFMTLKSHTEYVSAPVLIPAGGVELRGDLAMPEHAKGLIVFAHGSGSSRLSPRNQFVARSLYDAGLATLLIDLLAPEEEQIDRVSGHLRFNIDLLAGRLVHIIDWLIVNKDTQGLKVGLFGASTGAAAAIVAAARRDKFVSTVVSRGGRPDLAGRALFELEVPTLFIVGGADHEVLALNKKAQSQMTCVNKIAVIPGATHLFEEPGALEEVTVFARDWFAKHLC